MSTEMLMRNVFGDRYYGLASAYQEPVLFRRDVRKLVKKLDKDVDALIASDNFKSACKLYLERIETGLKTADDGDSFRAILVYALDVITLLMGYHYQSGDKQSEPYFIPTMWQERQGWREAMEYYEYNDQIMSKRKQIIAQLKTSGHTYAEIAEIMSLSKYRVAQILREVRQDDEVSS